MIKYDTNMKNKKWFIIWTIIMLSAGGVEAQVSKYSKTKGDFLKSRLDISENKRFLQYSDGTPFFYLGDTAWELFHRTNEEEADLYLEDRARKGFTVIQAVALAELDGISVPNAYGFLPFENNDPNKPLIKEGADNDYWDYVDYVVKKANELNLYIGFLPTWGRYWHDGTPVFNKQNARSYGEFLGRRYKEAQIIWILGGDRNPENENQKEVIRAMAEGLAAGDGKNHLRTFHPTGGQGSAQFFHAEDWLDFNMRQNGHEVEYGNYSKTREDYNRTPAKPVMDGEPLYEDHPVAFQAKRRGHSIASDIRRALYWDLFNGAFGHTYGHHSIWQMYDPDKSGPINNPLMSWCDAIHQPGSEQMIYGRLLIESRPFFTRIPATEKILVMDGIPTAMPGEGRYRFVATCDQDFSYAMIYAPVGRKFKVRMNVLKGDKIKAWWYNPRTGEASNAGIYSNKGEQTFISPDLGEMIDWILVLDDASKKYPVPGKS